MDHRLEDRYATNPGLLFDECKTKSYEWVVIDEVQKVPTLLDTVHRIIDTNEFVSPQVALTGSSARKLRHGGANLLAGPHERVQDGVKHLPWQRGLVELGL